MTNIRSVCNHDRKCHMVNSSTNNVARMTNSSSENDFDKCNDYIPDDTPIPAEDIASNNNSLGRFENLKPETISFDNFKTRKKDQ